MSELKPAYDHLDEAAHADMRVQVVLREVNQGALAGMQSEIGEEAARLIVAALDAYDADALSRAYKTGYQQGIEVERFRQEQARRRLEAS